MGQRGTTFETRLTVQQCASVFRESAGSAGVGGTIGGLAAKVMGNDNSGFYTPTDDSPFSALDGDKPTFMVGVFVPKFNGGGRGNGTNLHMYVWDRGGFRYVELVAPHGFGGGMHANKVVTRLTSAFRAADPAATFALA
jgi:hypothetical protein